MDKLSLQPIGLADIDLTQLSQPNLPTSSRLSALETLCTRLISHATSSAATITLLQSRLEAAEQSINNLVTSLEETRTQLGSTQSQLRSLQSSLVASDQLATETASSMAADIDYARQTAESVGMRLTQAEGEFGPYFVISSAPPSASDERTVFHVSQNDGKPNFNTLHVKLGSPRTNCCSNLPPCQDPLLDPGDQNQEKYQDLHLPGPKANKPLRMEERGCLLCGYLGRRRHPLLFRRKWSWTWRCLGPVPHPLGLNWPQAPCLVPCR